MRLQGGGWRVPSLTLAPGRAAGPRPPAALQSSPGGPLQAREQLLGVGVSERHDLPI
jgi:hypothetical protein